MSQVLQDASHLRQFQLERVLNEDPSTHSIALLGTFSHLPPGQRAIVRVESTAFSSLTAPSLLEKDLAKAELIESTDIYAWFLGWLNATSQRAHVKINVISPATDVHIRKYSRQQVVMVHETPEVYAKLVKPYIESFPRSRIQWVDDILSGVSEADKVLYRDTDVVDGYVLLPDMKWDLVTKSTLYLVAIAASANIKSLRDLRKSHLGMLCSIRREATRIVYEKWSLGPGNLRMFVHYQPSYYQFHVHIVNANYAGLLGMAVGQAHLLDDIISLLSIDGDIFEKITLSYILGEQHGLYNQYSALGIE